MMDKNSFYVYALVDPRKNEFFYIGKGKGRRYSAHLIGNDNQENSLKNRRIRQIEKDLFKVKFEVLFSDLDETTALQLEKLIIYRLGREVLFEGLLTNLVPGGTWDRWNDSVFHSDSYPPNFNINSLSLEDQEKLSSIKKVSNFNYLQVEDKNPTIYKYSIAGEFIAGQSLDEFFRGGITSERVEILKSLRENDLPIYWGYIYSKKYFQEVYVSDSIPLDFCDIVDQSLHKKFDHCYNITKHLILESRVDDTVRMRVAREPKNVMVETFFPSGKKKYSIRRRDGERFGSFKRWYENGKLKSEQIYERGEKKSFKSFYEDGGKCFEVNNFKPGNKIYNRWHENGYPEMKYVEGVGYLCYNSQGKYLRTVHPETSGSDNQMTIKFE